jgi:hypothetical protein
VKIVALLSWWNENPAWLTRCVTPLGRFVDHLVAVDGAYEHVSGSHEHARSSGDQADAIVAACDGTGLALTLHRPTEPWIGDEVAKRTFMFQAAALLTEPGDWLFVVDADEFVQEVPASIRSQLEQATEDGFEVGQIDMASPPPARGVDLSRRFFLADPSFRVEGRHFHYVAGPTTSPRLLWGDGSDPRLLPAVHIEGFRSEHWTAKRHPYRRQAQLDYYARRKKLRLEHDV